MIALGAGARNRTWMPLRAGNFEFYPAQNLLIFKPLISGHISRKY
jgi:hypothetical protein